MKITCKICNEQFAKNFFRKHLKDCHNIDSIEKYSIDILEYTNKCLHCGAPTKFINLNKKFREFCSNSCSSKYHAMDSDIKLKRANTNLIRYGGIPSKNSEVKSKAARTRDNLSKDPSYQLAVNNKRKDTCLLKYGVEYTSQSKQYKDSIDTKLKEKYELLTDSTLVSRVDDNYYRFRCNKCGLEYSAHRHLVANRNSNNIACCTNCVKKTSYSIPEIDLSNFISQNYDGKIELNNRTILAGKELDIYLPDLNLAFEFNGLYWHSEIHRDVLYHKTKTEDCEALGIQLIQIYEDDWNTKQDIVKSRILNLLGKCDRFYARKCDIIRVTSKETNRFLIDNHIQGKVNSNINYGLSYNGKLISIMTFGINRFRKDKTIELFRFCNKLNTTVVGGASRLFSNAVKENGWDNVLSYADRSWSLGNLYMKLNFKLIGSTPPNYKYIISGVRENRFKYRKSELVKQGFDSSLTEKQIMFERGFYRIYDSGSLIYEYIAK